MNTVSKQIENHLLSAVPAANADRLAETHAPAHDQTGGWDAYEVWNRFIKEARERRRESSDRPR